MKSRLVQTILLPQLSAGLMGVLKFSSSVLLAMNGLLFFSFPRRDDLVGKVLTL